MLSKSDWFGIALTAISVGIGFLLGGTTAGIVCLVIGVIALIVWHFKRDDFLPEPPADKATDKRNTDRVFIKVHPTELMPLASKKRLIVSGAGGTHPETEARYRENESTFGIYIGQWWAIEGTILHMYKTTIGYGRRPVDGYEVICKGKDNLPAVACQFSAEAIEGLVARKPGDRIRVVGQVESIDTLIRLELCELGDNYPAEMFQT